MAKKPAAQPATANAAEISAMDYAQHESTYRGFISFTKVSIVSLAFVVLSLYCFIEAGNPWLGALLLAVIPLGLIAATLTRSRRL